MAAPDATHITQYDHGRRELRVRLPLWHVGVLAVAKLLDSLSTLLVLQFHPGIVAENNPVTAMLIVRSGEFVGVATAFVITIATVATLAELAGFTLAWVRDRTGAPLGWLPYAARAYTYYFAAAWFALLAVSNLAHLAALILGGVAP